MQVTGRARKTFGLLLPVVQLGQPASVSAQDFRIPPQADKPTEYVEENPAAFAEAYFDFKAVRVYEPPKFGAHVDVSLNADVSGATEA